jgi:hypothetical protein
LLDYRALGWCALAVAIALAVIALAERWRLRWSLTRLLVRIRGIGNKGWMTHPQLRPESLYVVRLSESGVSCTNPEGATESVTWADLRQVEIVTTDQGPFFPDVFLVLHGSKADCVVPQGATGDRELFERLQQLPSFRNEVVIEAMSSTDNRRFLCWEQTDSTETEAVVDRPRE